MQFKYEAISEELMPNGFNVRFEGIIHYVAPDGTTHPWGTVENKGDGGCNIYFWAHPSYGRSFLRKAQEVITNPQFAEIDDEYVEYLYDQSIGVER